MRLRPSFHDVAEHVQYVQLVAAIRPCGVLMYARLSAVPGIQDCHDTIYYNHML